MRAILAATAVVAAVAMPLRDLSKYNFETFAVEFAKQYGAERELRKSIFEDNLKTIRNHNEAYLAGNRTWFMDANEFADWTAAEFQLFQKRRNGAAWVGGVTEVEEISVGAENPASIDWRTKNVVTPVKNQKQCGSCWAFSATESMESHFAIATGKLLVLAPQAYVDCVQNPNGCGGTGGCEGATMELAFDTSKAKGLPLETDLPYKGRDGSCPAYKAAAQNTGYTKISPINSAAALETALATKGPVSVTVAAEPWQLYGGGLFDGCSKGSSGADLDHGVQAVGYTADYWIVRNSWGPSWGEKGYIRLSRKADDKTFTDKSPGDGIACKPIPKTQTVGGECGILFDTSYPTGLSAPSGEIVV